MQLRDALKKAPQVLANCEEILREIVEKIED